MYRFRRFYFEADKGTGGGDATPPVEPPAEKKVIEDVKNPTGGDKSGKEPGAIQMTSEQLAERLERAKNAERAALLKELGFADVDQAKSATTRLADLEKASMTAQERAEAELAAARSQAETSRAQAEAADKARRDAVIRSEAMVQMTGKFANPATAYRLLNLDGVQVGDDGQVSGVREAVDKLAQDEPWALIQTANGKKVITTVGPTNIEAGKDAKAGDAERKAKFFGGGGNRDFFSGGGIKTGG